MVAAWVPVWAEPDQALKESTSETVMLSDMTVNAKKRGQEIQDVPVSVTAWTTEMLEDAQVFDIFDLTDQVSSLQILQQGSLFNTKIFLRGLGTSASDMGLESSVGLFVDEVYQNRVASVMNNLYDLEQVEVIRGPQSTLFGENSSAGVVSIRTRGPSFTPEYKALYSYGSFNERGIEMSASGPVSERLAYRLSVNQERRDGFYDNDYTGQALNNKNRDSIRGQLLFEPSDDFSLSLKVEHDQIDERCCNSVFYRHQSFNAGFLHALGAREIQTNPDSGRVNVDSQPNYQHDQTRWMVRADRQFEWVTFSSLSSYQRFDSEAHADLDGTELDILSPESANSDRIGVFSQEFRWTSPSTGAWQWIGGLSYLNQDLDLGQSYRYGSSMRPYVDLTTTVLSGGTPFVDPSPIDLLEIVTAVPSKTYFSSGQGLQRGDYDLKSDSLSLFGQVDWGFSERFTLGSGLRWTVEKKRLHSRYQINDPFAALDLSPGGAIAAINPAFTLLSGLQFFKPVPNQNLSRVENYLSGGLSLTFRADAMRESYLSYHRGYKSGGFQVTSFVPEGGVEFDREMVDAFEFGMKLKDRDHRWRANLAMFYQMVDGYQVFVREKNTIAVRNASDVSILGFELEGLWQISSNWFLEQSTTFLDAEFVDFENTPCPFGAATPTCSLSGKSVPSIPDWSTSTTLMQSTQWGAFHLQSRLQHVYKDKRVVAINHDPDTRQESIHLFNASFTLTRLGQPWSLMLWGKNLTNEHYTESIIDSVVLIGDLTGYPGDPRTVGMTVSVTLD